MAPALPPLLAATAVLYRSPLPRVACAPHHPHPAGGSLKHLSIDWPDDLQLSQWLGTLTALEVGQLLSWAAYEVAWGSRGQGTVLAVSGCRQ